MSAPTFGAAAWARRLAKAGVGACFVSHVEKILEPLVGDLIEGVRLDEARKCLRAAVDADAGKECEAIDARVRLHEKARRRG